MIDRLVTVGLGFASNRRRSRTSSTAPIAFLRPQRAGVLLLAPAEPNRLMRFVDEYRDSRVVHSLLQRIAAEVSPDRSYRLMEFCGGHTHAIARHALEELLPSQVQFIHGPGCPVCVLPAGRIESAIYLAQQPATLLCSYGDMLRVPGATRRSLLVARSEGAHVQMTYSIIDALRLAQSQPDRQIVFFAIGFETTTPPTAVAIQQAERLDIRNFSVFCNHVLTPSALSNILESPDIRTIGSISIDGFIGPAHVCAVIGTQPFEYFADEYERPVVVTGFEPVDLLEGVLMLVRQINERRYVVENQYRRLVTRRGNLTAQALVADVFELRRDFLWRGLGRLPYSALRIKSKYATYDAECRFDVPQFVAKEPAGCDCGAILRGAKRPSDCHLFGRSCTPEQPIGPCMVSAEGACAAHWRWGQHRAKSFEVSSIP